MPNITVEPQWYLREGMWIERILMSDWPRCYSVLERRSESTTCESKLNSTKGVMIAGSRGENHPIMPLPSSNCFFYMFLQCLENCNSSGLRHLRAFSSHPIYSNLPNFHSSFELYVACTPVLNCQHCLMTCNGYSHPYVSLAVSTASSYRTISF